MKELFILITHLLATLVRLAQPGGVRAVVAQLTTGILAHSPTPGSAAISLVNADIEGSSGRLHSRRREASV